MNEADARPASRGAAFITGGGSGIGRACALRLARDGYGVAVADLNGAGARQVADEVRAAGGTALAIELDVTRSADVDRAVDICVEALGPLYMVLANAGIGVLAPIMSMTDEEWLRNIDVDLNGAFYTLRAGARQLVRQNDGGVLLSTSSAYAGISGFGNAAYCAAKSGVLRITQCAAIELGEHGIRVNTIGPGVIRTPLTAMQETSQRLNDATMDALAIKRLGDPDEIAAMVAYLSSDAASYITGQIFYVDGGMTLKGGIDLQTALDGVTTTFGS